MVAVSSNKVEISLDDVLDGKPIPELPARRIFREIVEEVAEHAKESLPEANGRVERARELVLAGAVTRNEDGTFTVRSQSSKGKSYEVNGSCRCSDAEKGYQCKHLIATWIWRKARKAVEQNTHPLLQSQEPPEQEQTEHASADVSTLSPLPDSTVHSSKPSVSIPSQFIQLIHGKEFVQYAGLLAMAHDKGLATLKATFISVTDEIALAEATATFTDGRVFTEGGDATPNNVHPKVKPHFARMALTRAKARALRDALNIAMCAVEEME